LYTDVILDGSNPCLSQLHKGGMKIGSDLTHPLKLKTVTDVQMIPAPTCIVKNMTCSEFPLKSKCRGIGIGRCGSNVDMLKQRLRGELLRFPLRENPFFAKVIEIEFSYNLNTDGILSNETELGSYNCQVIGDLQCENEQMPVCSGLGVIDCTDDCPGTEEEFKYFREVTEDPDFVTKFPIITGIGKNDKTKTKKMFLESLTKCKTFSEETLMVIQLAQGQR